MIQAHTKATKHTTSLIPRRALLNKEKSFYATGEQIPARDRLRRRALSNCRVNSTSSPGSQSFTPQRDDPQLTVYRLQQQIQQQHKCAKKIFTERQKAQQQQAQRRPALEDII